ncbi:DUF6799 domain-containing protein [Hymenobacter metallicola]|uniref:DUF6799 domain-containing protein n=1 Tax=Hymenobacter metallicola TaxID=2563114 RepID=A0A4Z0QDN8_9BACT|nr:DUF6799 domain-containing protein [Hymenobacter metallicola]TGE27469.1 hypothetical protein E5K02_13910 [Hymenobacter metallicola]
MLLLSSLVLSLSAWGQGRSANDGFQRRDGAMYVIRNGVKRPMTHDAHLPNGRVITRDGFVVARDGSRQELTEGRGCNLSGAVVPVTTGPGGQLLLAAAPPAPAAAGQVGAAAYLQQLLMSNTKRRGWGYYKKGKHGKGRGKHKKHDD